MNIPDFATVLAAVIRHNQTLLAEALGAWSEQFDGPEDHDLSISGADLVEWFAEWRLRARDQLSAQSAT